VHCSPRAAPLSTANARRSHLPLICRRKSDASIDPRLPLGSWLADHDGRFAHDLQSTGVFVCETNADRAMCLRASTQKYDFQIKELFESQPACAMPVSVRDGALLGAGMTLVAASTFFYRRKQTLPFKVRSSAIAPLRRLSSTTA